MKNLRWSPEALLTGCFALLWLAVLVYSITQRKLFFSTGLPIDDAAQYSNLALSLLHNGVYALDGITPFFEREPGYSVFLAAIYGLFGDGAYIAAFTAHAVLHVWAALFLIGSFRTIITDRARYITLGFLLFFPAIFHILFSLTRESLALSCAMVFAGCMLHVSKKDSPLYAWIGGALLGCLILTYSPFLLFPAFLLVVLLLWRVHWMHIAFVLIAAAVVIAPWAIRNIAHTGNPCLTGCYRAALQWHVRGEQAETIHGLEPARCLWAEYISRDYTGRSPNCNFNAVWHRKWPDGFKGVPEDAVIAHEGQAKILRNFPNYIWFSLFEVIELHLPYVNGWGRSYNIAAAVSTLLLYLGCAVSLLFIRRKEYLLIAAFMLYITALFALTDAIPRYLTPILFCYALLAGVGYDHALARIWRR